MYPSSTEYFILYSKFSLECKTLFEHIKQRAQSVTKPVRWVSCDNTRTRQVALLYTDSVPSLLVFRQGYLVDRVDDISGILSHIAPSPPPLEHSPVQTSVQTSTDVIRSPDSSSDSAHTAPLNNPNNPGNTLKALAQQMENERNMMDGELKKQSTTHDGL